MKHGFWCSVLVGLAWLLSPGVHAATSNQVKVQLIVTNAQGSVVAKMSPSGTVTYSADYRPYGRTQDAAQPGPGYGGHVEDPATGLVYMQQRYYDPVVGRFISPDPVLPTPGNIYNINRYVYAANNPIRYTDPDGKCIDGVTCGSMLSQHVQWRMSHPNAPVDGLEKAAIVVVGVMASATGAEEVGGVAAAIKTAVRTIAGKVDGKMVRKVVKTGGSKQGERTIAIGEDMEGRVIPFAKKAGADWYKPDPSASPSKWMGNNRKWINDRMDEGCKILDCGAAPSRTKYPEPTSPYYRMERSEIWKRQYKNYLKQDVD